MTDWFCCACVLDGDECVKVLKERTKISNTTDNIKKGLIQDKSIHDSAMQLVTEEGHYSFFYEYCTPSRYYCRVLE